MTNKRSSTRTKAKPTRGKTRGYPRGDETRARIVAAALPIFSAHGLDGSSTRLIAKHAGVNLAALPYYFGSKEGLYLACAEHIASHAEAEMKPASEGIAAALANPALSRAQLVAMLRGVVEGTAESLASPKPLDAWLMFLIREQTSPTAALDILFQRVLRPILGNLAALIRRIEGGAPDDPDAMIRAVGIWGLMVIFFRMRGIALRSLGWKDLTGERLAQAKMSIWRQIEGSLASPAAPAGAPGHSLPSQPPN